MRTSVNAAARARCATRTAAAVLCAWLAGTAQAPAHAQDPQDAPAPLSGGAARAGAGDEQAGGENAGVAGPAQDGFRRLRWWHPAAAAAGVGLLFAVDRPVRDFVQDHRSAAADDVARVARRFHEAKVPLVAGGGAMAIGLLVRDDEVAQTGLQIVTAYGLSTGLMIATKWTFGRSRPSQTPDDATRFDWFGGGENSAFPSGAAAVSFSLATTVADAVHHPAATVVLYTAAAANSWARVYADRHWLSDVALGALYGVAAAKLVNGRWRLFGWRPPTVGIAAGRGVSLAYRFEW